MVASPVGDPRPTDDYLALMRCFPTGVAVITSMGDGDRPHGLTCTSLSSVTLTPPTLLLCLDVRSGTLAALRACGMFAVNLLHARGQQAAEIFASRDPERFGKVRWELSRLAGMPWLVDDAFVLAECKVASITTVGDHEIVLGKVLGVTHTADTPLLYGMRRFASWGAGV